MPKHLLPFAALLLALLLPPPGARADEPDSLLERLNAETVALADRADGATARVRTDEGEAQGVLVGSPPRLVVAWLVSRGERTLHAVLENALEVEATLVAADDELGVAVYALPETAAREVHGLALAPDDAVRRGTLVLSAGERPRLLVVGGVDPLTRAPKVEASDAGGALVTTRGELAGIAVERAPGATRARFLSAGSLLRVVPRLDAAYVLDGNGREISGAEISGAVVPVEPVRVTLPRLHTNTRAGLGLRRRVRGAGPIPNGDGAGPSPPRRSGGRSRISTRAAGSAPRTWASCSATCRRRKASRARA